MRERRGEEGREIKIIDYYKYHEFSFAQTAVEHLNTSQNYVSKINVISRKRVLSHSR